MRTDASITSSGLRNVGHLYVPEGLGSGTHPAIEFAVAKLDDHFSANLTAA